MIKLEADEKYCQAAHTPTRYSSYCAEKKATGFQTNMTTIIDDFDKDGYEYIIVFLLVKEKNKNVLISNEYYQVAYGFIRKKPKVVFTQTIVILPIIIITILLRLIIITITPFLVIISIIRKLPSKSST